MTTGVKRVKPPVGSSPPRRTRRDVAAEATERAIVDAALALLRERGYTATTMEDLASAAGVAVQTIYNSIGGKRSVLSRVIDYVAAGPEAPTPVPSFMRERTASATSAQEIIGILGDWFVDSHQRMADVWPIVEQAAAVDPDVARLERVRAAQRFRNYREAAAAIARLGGLAGLDEPGAAAAIWTVSHPVVRRFLIADQAWSEDRYRTWLLETLGRVLLANPHSADH
ncbi:MAG TPA: TetR/AcrR family transcriptional regulator [Candidatus Limnocylindrales bacterium]|nr:TetR/AcrR family transcriptional regulator [Candidatus Limnocylindrales bacterium]